MFPSSVYVRHDNSETICHTNVCDVIDDDDDENETEGARQEKYFLARMVVLFYSR